MVLPNHLPIIIPITLYHHINTVCLKIRPQQHWCHHQATIMVTQQYQQLHQYVSACQVIVFNADYDHGMNSQMGITNPSQTTPYYPTQLEYKSNPTPSQSSSQTTPYYPTQQDYFYGYPSPSPSLLPASASPSLVLSASTSASASALPSPSPSLSPSPLPYYGIPFQFQPFENLPQELLQDVYFMLHLTHKSISLTLLMCLTSWWARGFWQCSICVVSRVWPQWNCHITQNFLSIGCMHWRITPILLHWMYLEQNWCIKWHSCCLIYKVFLIVWDLHSKRRHQRQWFLETAVITKPNIVGCWWVSGSLKRCI